MGRVHIGVMRGKEMCAMIQRRGKGGSEGEREREREREREGRDGGGEG